MKPAAEQGKQPIGEARSANVRVDDPHLGKPRRRLAEAPDFVARQVMENVIGDRQVGSTGEMANVGALERKSGNAGLPPRKIYRARVRIDAEQIDFEAVSMGESCQETQHVAAAAPDVENRRRARSERRSDSPAVDGSPTGNERVDAGKLRVGSGQSLLVAVAVVHALHQVGGAAGENQAQLAVNTTVSTVSPGPNDIASAASSGSTPRARIS